MCPNFRRDGITEISHLGTKITEILRIDYGHNLDSDTADEANQALVLLLNCIIDK